MNPGSALRVVRSLARARSYSLGVVLTLAIGVGLSASVLSIVRGLVLRPLPHADGDRLVYVRQSAPGVGVENAYLSVPEIDDYRRGVPAFQSVAEFSAMRFGVLDLDRPREVSAGIVTGNYFDVMGLGAILGRTMGPGDDGRTARPVAVLTAPFWQSVLGGDPEVLGRTIRMDGRTVEIVGVAEPHPPYPEETDLYVNLVTSPHHLDAAMTDDRVHRMTETFARLAPGSDLEQAREQVRTVFERGVADHPEAYPLEYRFTVRATSLKDQLAHRARTVLLILAATVSLVYLISVANVAHLVFARVVQRSDELALRASLGATEARIRAHVLEETVTLTALATVLGALVALASRPLLVAFAARYSVRAAEIGVDPWVLTSTAAIGGATALALSYLPGLPTLGSLSALARAGRTGRSRHSRRAGQVGVVLQLGFTFVLLFGAGALAATVSRLQAIDVGMATEEVLSMTVPLTLNGRSSEEIRDDALAMVEAAAAVPGVESAALTNVVPFRTREAPRAWTFEFGLEGRAPEPGEPPFRAGFRSATEGLPPTLGLRLVRGRFVEAGDDERAPRVVAVNQTFVDRFFGGEDPLGSRLSWGGDIVRYGGVSPEPRAIVGVVSDVHDDRLRGEPPATIYMPYRQEPWSGALLVRTSVDPWSVAAPIAAAVRTVEPDQAVEKVAVLDELRVEAFRDERLNARLVGLLAVLGALIAAVGLFATLDFSVACRTSELGVRRALGATGGRVVGQIVGEGLALVAGGVTLGLVGAWLASGFLAGLVFGVSALDARTLATGAAVLVALSLCASWIPARRAARVSPSRALVSG